MKLFLLLFFVAVASTVGCSTKSMAEGPKEIPQIENEVSADVSPVLVELFTSEGCSSCPPADRTLMFLQMNQPVRNAKIIALGFHVDYWDYLGWKDKFSSAQFSSRQREYVQAFRLDSSYTPQMVVDGESEFVGSNLQNASNFIEAAAKKQKATVNLTINGGQIGVAVDKMPSTAASTVYLAVAEHELSTKVRGGENRGSDLAHPAVVRYLKAIGNIKNGKLESALSVDIPKSDEWVSKNLSYVVFIQQDETKKIDGVGAINAK